MRSSLPCIDPGGGGRAGGTVQVGGPFAEKEGLEKSSSDGLVKEVLIWLHRALILQSPSPGNPISISGTSKKVTHRGEVGKERKTMERSNIMERRSGMGEEEDGQRDEQTKRGRRKIFIHLCNRPSIDPILKTNMALC